MRTVVIVVDPILVPFALAHLGACHDAAVDEIHCAVLDAKSVLEDSMSPPASARRARGVHVPVYRDPEDRDFPVTAEFLRIDDGVPLWSRSSRNPLFLVKRADRVFLVGDRNNAVECHALHRMRSWIAAARPQCAVAAKFTWFAYGSRTKALAVPKGAEGARTWIAYGARNSRGAMLRAFQDLAVSFAITMERDDSWGTHLRNKEVVSRMLHIALSNIKVHLPAHVGRAAVLSGVSGFPVVEYVEAMVRQTREMIDSAGADSFWPSFTQFDPHDHSLPARMRELGLLSRALQPNWTYTERGERFDGYVGLRKAMYDIQRADRISASEDDDPTPAVLSVLSDMFAATRATKPSNAVRMAGSWLKNAAGNMFSRRAETGYRHVAR